jgi:tetratricopeptide (TPR) repeat protein
MIHNPSKDYFQKINSINRFFTRTEAQGYIFVSAQDQRLIKNINQTLIERAAEKDKTIHVLFIKNTDEWTVMQNIREFQKTEEKVDGIILGNLDEYIIKKGKALVDEVNFSREAFQALGIPILIWVTKEHLSLFSNRAVDFYTQREGSTIFFEGKLEIEQNELLESRFNENYKTEEEFKAIEVKIDLLKKQLQEAENGEYSRIRIANGLVLDLIRAYSEVQIYQPALNLIEEYKDDLLPTVDNFIIIGKLYINCNEWDKAIKVIDKAFKLAEKNGEEENLELAEIYSLKGLSLKYKGEYSNALKCLSKVIEIGEKKLGQNHPALATSYNNIAAIYQDKGEIENALKFNLKALEINEKDLDKNHPDLATSYNNIAALYKDKGEIEKALKFNFKALEIREKILDENHPVLATSYNNIAMVYQDKGEIEKALKFNLKALEIKEKVLYKNHPDLANSYNNIALVYRDKGEIEKALKFNLKALEIREKVLYKNHPDLATSYNNIASVYQDKGEKEKALKFNFKALEIREKVLDKNHPVLASSYNNIAWGYFYLEKYLEAKNYMEKAIQINTQKLSSTHPHSLESVKGLEIINRALTQSSQSKTSGKVLPKIGRNDKISVKYTDGRIVNDVKYKKVMQDLKSGICELI